MVAIPSHAGPATLTGGHGSRPHKAFLREPVLLAVGVVASLLLHRTVPAISALTWAVLLGVVVANLSPPRVRHAVRPGRLAKVLLRAGVALLGFSLSLRAVLQLGWSIFAVVAVSLVGTLLVTYVVGRSLGLDRPRSLLIATGFSICGASAIVAMEEPAKARDEDVTAAIALVTLYGTLAMVALPLLQGPLGLSDFQAGVWAGASVHEVGQVVAAAGSVGGAAVGIAVVVKLTRVLFLAPVVIAVQTLQRRLERRSDSAANGRRPPLVPGFVAAFVVCVLVRTTGLVPGALLDVIAHVQTAALAAALFGLGLGVSIRRLLTSSGTSALVGLVSTLFIVGVTWAGVVLVA